MHYKNGREARNGDMVILLPTNGAPVIGMLYGATPGNDYCNGRIAPVGPYDPSPNLKECLALDDFMSAMPAEIPNTAVPLPSAPAPDNASSK